MLFKKSVDSILTSINSNISDLKKFAESETEIAQAEREKADGLIRTANDRFREASRATAVAGKLEDLILVPVDVAD